MNGKIVNLSTAVEARQKARAEGLTVVFTNGVFDILHRGHVEYLQKARSLGDMLVVGLNSDASVRRIKGPGRPINPQEDRAAVLAALACVDSVVVFEEDTPQALIEAVVPDVLVKGADWKVEEIVGADVVLRNGGRVANIELTPGRSTTDVINRIIERTKGS